MEQTISILFQIPPSQIILSPPKMAKQINPTLPKNLTSEKEIILNQGKNKERPKKNGEADKENGEKGIKFPTFQTTGEG